VVFLPPSFETTNDDGKIVPTAVQYIMRRFGLI